MKTLTKTLHALVFVSALFLGIGTTFGAELSPGKAQAGASCEGLIDHRPDNQSLNYEDLKNLPTRKAR